MLILANYLTLTLTSGVFLPKNVEFQTNDDFTAT